MSIPFELVANGALVDAVIFAFPPAMFPASLPFSVQAILDQLTYSAAAAAALTVYLAPVGALAPENQIMLINDTLQWATRGCIHVPRVAVTGVPWELRATRATIVNSTFRGFFRPGS